jgi:multidrug efflux pump subunit AcrA (membrane-fusion protein)
MIPSDNPTAARPGLWARFRLAVLVPLARLRFLVILGIIGLAITKRDLLVAWYEKHTRPAEAPDAAASDVEYYCPMHPAIVRDNNKEKCPICFMPLSRRKKGEATDEALPAGTVARVQLSPYRVVLAGVRTAPVAWVPLHRDITTVGTVEFDERALRTVAARFKGRIDTLFVNQTGQQVSKGDPLASIYSPDIVVTVQNLLDARKANSPDREANARRRLAQWGVEDDQIDEILKAGKPVTHLTVRSPMTGHVVRKYAREGQYVDEGGVLFEVADLSIVWVQAQFYEEDLAFLPPGAHNSKTGLPDVPLPVEATTRGRPGETFTGKLSFVFPHVDPDSRTLTARFELANPDHELRPGMTATVRLRIEGAELPKLASGKRVRIEDGKVLAVPEAAVIDTGRQQVVYRESLPNTFDGVLVELGPKLTDADGVPYFPVLSGLRPGDSIAIGGAFLIDAETRLNPAAGSIYVGGSGTGGNGVSPVRPSTPEDTDAKVTAALGKLSPDDRVLAASQKFCPVLPENRLGSMGVPIKLILDGEPVFVCCPGCVDEAKSDPVKFRKRADELRAKRGTAPAAPKPSKEEEKIRTSLSKLSPADRALAEAQKVCPITEEPLGVMGTPVKVMVKGRPVFVCCKGCDEEALDKADEVLRKVDEFKQGNFPKR